MSSKPRASEARRRLTGLKAELQSISTGVIKKSDSIKPLNGWSAEESAHHRTERASWRTSTILSGAIFVGAGLSAYFTYKAASEARRQADIAEQSLILSNRAWLQFSVDPKPVFFQVAAYEKAITDISKDEANQLVKRKVLGASSNLFDALNVGTTIEFQVAIQNLGTTPALDVEIKASFFMIDDYATFANACANDNGSRTLSASVAPKETFVARAVASGPVEEDADPAGHETYYVTGLVSICATYKVLGDPLYHHALRTYVLGAVNGPDSGLSWSSYDLSNWITNIDSLKAVGDIHLFRKFDDELMD